MCSCNLPWHDYAETKNYTCKDNKLFKCVTDPLWIAFISHNINASGTCNNTIINSLNKREMNTMYQLLQCTKLNWFWNLWKGPKASISVRISAEMFEDPSIQLLFIYQTQIAYHHHLSELITIYHFLFVIYSNSPFSDDAVFILLKFSVLIPLCSTLCHLLSFSVYP